jgi:hypothetical protein
MTGMADGPSAATHAHKATTTARRYGAPDAIAAGITDETAKAKLSRRSRDRQYSQRSGSRSPCGTAASASDKDKSRTWPAPASDATEGAYVGYNAESGPKITRETRSVSDGCESRPGRTRGSRRWYRLAHSRGKGPVAEQRQASEANDHDPLVYQRSPLAGPISDLSP